MKISICLIMFLMTGVMTSASVANANCGRFADPIKSILKDTQSAIFDFNKVAKLSSSSHCFSYEPGIRCDLIYDNIQYYFFFSDKFTKADVANDTVENFFNKWLSSSNGKSIMLNTYNTLYELDNDYEGIECSNWYEELTHSIVIDDKESQIL